MAKTREWMRDILESLHRSFWNLANILDHDCRGFHNYVFCPLCAERRHRKHILSALYLARAHNILGPELFPQEAAIVAVVGTARFYRMVSNDLNTFIWTSPIICQVCGHEHFVSGSKRELCEHFETNIQYSFRCKNCNTLLYMTKEHVEKALNSKKRPRAKKAKLVNIKKIANRLQVMPTDMF